MKCQIRNYACSQHQCKDPLAKKGHVIPWPSLSTKRRKKSFLHKKKKVIILITKKQRQVPNQVDWGL